MASPSDWESSLTVSQLEAYLSDEVSTQFYERNLELKVSVVTSALGPYLRTYHFEASGDQDGGGFLSSGGDREGLFGKAKRDCLDFLQRLPSLMETLWGVAMPKELGDCCLDRKKKQQEKVRCQAMDCYMDKVTVLKSSPFHYRCVCVLYIHHGEEGSADSWVLEELIRTDAGVRNTSKLLGRVYHPTITECVSQLRRHLRGFDVDKVSIILCLNNKEMLITIHTSSEASKRPSEGTIQAALESSTADLRRVYVNIVADEARARGLSNDVTSRSGDDTRNHRRKIRKGSLKKVDKDYVMDCYHLDTLSADISLQFKEGHDAIANPTLEINKLNWMVDVANQCLGRIPCNGRRQLLEVPLGSSLESLALGKLFDGKLRLQLLGSMLPTSRWLMPDRLASATLVLVGRLIPWRKACLLLRNLWRLGLSGGVLRLRGSQKGTITLAVSATYISLETVCIIDGHKGKASATWSKFKLNSMDGKVKVVRGNVSSKIAVLQGHHQFDMVAIGVDRSGLSGDVLNYLSSLPCILYTSDYSASMRKDIRLLSITHKAQQLGLFDTAPFDERLECCIVMLRYKMEKNQEQGGDWRPSTKREGEYVDVEGHKTHVYEIEPDTMECRGAIVLVAGVGSDGTFFPRDEILNRLQNEGYQLLLVDLWGRGFSDCPHDGRYDASRYSKQIMAAVDKFVPSDVPVYLLGMSLGGCVVVHCAAANPERISGVLAICPAGCGLGKLQEWFLPIIKRVKSPISDILGTLAEIISYELFFDPEKYPKIHENTMIDWMYNPAFFRAYTNTLRDFPLEDGLKRYLPEVKCPVRILLGGSDDTVNTPKVAEYLNTLKGSINMSYKIIPNQPHDVCLTVPNEVTDEMLKLIQNCPKIEKVN